MAPEATITPPAETTDTKERLLAAGMLEFAEHGFRDASIRRICGRAGANAAAVNYHFGDKQRFYAEVLVTCHQRATARRPMPRLADDPDRPPEVLRAWIRWYLELLLLDATSSPLGKLMAREMFQPTAAFDSLIRRSIAPLFTALTEIVAAVLGHDDPLRLRLSVHSVLGQCLLYKHAQAAMERMRNLVPDAGPHPADDLDALARHVADFSLAGLNGVSR